MSRFHGPALLVRHHVAGGTEHGGGIGRLVGYVCAARSGAVRHEVTDTRGPRVRPVRSSLRLARAMALIAADRVRAPASLQQFHIAGRGSTVRKTVLGLWARAIGAPYVLHLHDYDYAADLARRPRWQLGLVRALFRGAWQVIVLGRKDRETVIRVLGVAPGRITVLRYCVPDPGPQAHRAGRDVHLLFLGRLGPRKGVPELLAALADPAMPESGWHATLAGDGPVEAYRAEADRLGVSDRVRLTGWLCEADTAALRAQADVLVLPSHAEGFAMAVLEGLASGLAVVTTRVGAHDEVLEDGRTCLFVPPGNARRLAEALASLVGNSARREALGAAGRALFLAEFDIAGYRERLEALQERAFLQHAGMAVAA